MISKTLPLRTTMTALSLVSVLASGGRASAQETPNFEEARVAAEMLASRNEAKTTEDAEGDAEASRVSAGGFQTEERAAPTPVTALEVETDYSNARVGSDDYKSHPIIEEKGPPGEDTGVAKR